MATTRYKIAEQVLRIVNGGSPTEDSSIDIREVMLLVDQERDALIKSEIMDWSYTKSTATAKGELEINGGWISQATVALGTDESRNGALVAPLHFGYISLPNDMGIQKVESCETRYQRQTSNYRVKGTILKTEYKRDKIDIVFNSGPKILDKKYNVSFDFAIGTTLMSNESTTQDQYGGVKTHKISFNVDTTGYNSYENQHFNFIKALVNSPGFKKFVKDFDIHYGVTENDLNDNKIIDAAASVLHVIQVRLSTNYGSDISNFTINGSGKNSIEAGPNAEYGGASISSTIIDDDIGFGWVIEKLEESVNSSSGTETALENSHGIGFIINDTMYTTEFVSPKVEVTYEDAIDKFILENANKIAKEQNIICKKSQEGVGSTGINYILVFAEIFPRGGFDIDMLTPGNAFKMELASQNSFDPTPAAEGYEQIIFHRMPSGSEHNSLYDKTVRKTGRQHYYIENLVEHGGSTGQVGGAAIYLYKKYDLDVFTNRHGNTLRIHYIGTSNGVEDHVIYPIPADYEKIIIKNLVELLTVMKNASDDMANDNID